MAFRGETTFIKWCLISMFFNELIHTVDSR